MYVYTFTNNNKCPFFYILLFFVLKTLLSYGRAQLKKS